MARYSGDLIKLNGKVISVLHLIKFKEINYGVLILEEIWLVL